MMYKQFQNNGIINVFLQVHIFTVISTYLYFWKKLFSEMILLFLIFLEFINSNFIASSFFVYSYSESLKLTEDQTHNPGIYPDWELNWWPFTLQDDAQSTEPHEVGLFPLLIILSTDHLAPSPSQTLSLGERSLLFSSPQEQCLPRSTCACEAL